MSIAISLKFFLYGYFAFIAVWLIFNAVAFYHVLKYGFKNTATLCVICGLAFVSGSLLLVSGYFIQTMDWSAEIDWFFNLG